MSEVLRSFDEPFRHETGDYHARVVSRYAEDGMWEGWFEFVPIGAGSREVVVSSVESRQPERAHIAYWATGLTPVYVEGALQRALSPVTVRTRVVETPVSDAPAPRVVVRPARYSGPEPVLDPFEVGGRNLDILSQELTALNRPRLLNIIDAFELNPGGEEISGFSDAQLITFIVTAVDARLTARRR